MGEVAIGAGELCAQAVSSATGSSSSSSVLLGALLGAGDGFIFVLLHLGCGGQGLGSCQGAGGGVGGLDVGNARVVAQALRAPCERTGHDGADGSSQQVGDWEAHHVRHPHHGQASSM